MASCISVRRTAISTHSAFLTNGPSARKELADSILLFRRFLGCGEEEFHQSLAGCPSRPLLRQFGGGSTTPTFSATATAIHWFRETPSSAASRCAAFLTEIGSFNGYVALLIHSPLPRDRQGEGCLPKLRRSVGSLSLLMVRLFSRTKERRRRCALDGQSSSQIYVTKAGKFFQREEVFRQHS